jgi:cob(I)alamin adenosyltransferase
MALKIYTKTGDAGETALFGGRRLPKNHLRIECYGTVDELNAHIGVVSDWITNAHHRETLKEIQDRLFSTGASLAADPGKMDLPADLRPSDLELLEKEIDALEGELPPLKNFILPGGHPAVSFCHVARCVCRRAERLTVALSQSESVDPFIVKYLNRLSDYLFMLSRAIGQEAGAPEVIWKPR